MSSPRVSSGILSALARHSRLTSITCPYRPVDVLAVESGWMFRRTLAAISKSRYVSGLQCDKRLWTEVHARESIPPFDDATQAIFDQGTEVGQLATKLFPGGIEIGRKEFRWKIVVPATQKALTQRRPLFEAAFRAGGAACRVDVLDPVEDSAWDLYEVKSCATTIVAAAGR